MLTTQQCVFDTLGNFRTVKLRNGQTEFYQHDGQYRLVSLFLGSTLQYRKLYAEKDRIVAKVNNSGYLSEGYVHGVRGQTPEYIHKNSQKYRVVTDHLGSVRLVVNTTDGTIGQRMDYNEWGEVLNDTSPGFQPYGFAGGIYLVASKTVKFGARVYDPSTGRWLTKDPIRFEGGDTNFFGYVAQDPVNWTDPSGLKINDQTGGKIPAQVVNSPLYRQLDALPGTITINIDNSLNAAGVTNFRLGDPNQTIRINENNQLSSYDLQDTYIHEFNHALLNFSFNGQTDEFFDTNILLPGQINKNLKGPGRCPK